jgi:hypothetical protein
MFNISKLLSKIPEQGKSLPANREIAKSLPKNKK